MSDHQAAPARPEQPQLALKRAGIDDPRFREVGTDNKPRPRPLHPESVNALLQQALARAGLDA